MKKDFKNFLYGFTMAEILISITIAMIVATAMVPVLGTKKVKHPNNKIYHGIAACYYDANGNLQYDYRENRADAASREGGAAGDHCTFRIPKSSYLNVIAIGAGGSSTTNTIGYSGSIGVNYAGSLRIDTNYQFDIDASSESDDTLPGKIRTALDAWASRSPGQIYALYRNITSPIGAGGTGKCFARMPIACNDPNPARGGGGPNNSWVVARNDTSYSTNSRCWWYQHGLGGNSGQGLRKASLQIPLNGSSNIQLEETTSRTIVGVSDNYITLSSSGAGGNANCSISGTSCTSGANSNVNATCSGRPAGNCSGVVTYGRNSGANGGTEQPGKTCLDNIPSATPGYVEFLNKASGSNQYGRGAIDWEYKRPLIDVTFSGAGNYGSEISQVFENIKGTLQLYPARDNTRNTRVIKDGMGEILTASSGTNVGNLKRTAVEVNETFPKEVTDLAIRDNINHFDYLNKIKGSGFNIPLINCENNETCPGFGGRGKYLLFKSTAGLETLTLTNRQNNASYVHDFGQDLGYRETQNCIDNDTRGNINVTAGADLVYSCTGRNRNGGRGAVIVLW